MNKRQKTACMISKPDAADTRGSDEEITDDTVLYHVQCKKCGGYLPPHTAWEHLNLDTEHGIFKCPHIEGSQTFPYNIRCNRCGRYLPFWIVFAANFPPCHPIHECPHDNWDDEPEECSRSEWCELMEADNDVQN